MNNNSKKMSLKAALSLIETIFVNGELQKFSIVHGYSDPKRLCEVATRNLCTRINPNEKDINFKEITKKNENGKLKKVFNSFDYRIIRIFDNEKNKYISVKVDLIIKVNNIIIEH